MQSNARKLPLNVTVNKLTNKHEHLQRLPHLSYQKSHWQVPALL